MTAFDGMRESWEAAPPRPWLLGVRRAVQIVLGLVCGLELVLWLMVLLP